MLATERKSLLIGKGHQGFGMCAGAHRVSAPLAEHGGKHLRNRERGGRLPLLRHGQRLLHPLLRLVGSAQRPQDLCQIAEGSHALIIHTVEDGGEGGGALQRRIPASRWARAAPKLP
jgi:hypothetical protein